MARLTRAESQTRTRERLLDAAAEMFTAKGFTASSLEEIAEAAGFSRGAVYSNFAGKDELFLAVMARRREARYHAVARILRDNPKPEEFIGALEAEDRDEMERRSWFLLETEFFLYAMRRPDALPFLAEHEETMRSEVAEAITVIFSTLGVIPPLPASQIAAVNQALEYGILYQHYVDRDRVPQQLYYDTLRYLLDTAVVRDR
jgi:AcrR family transcriptional regulator